MKKLIIALLVLSLLCLTACSGDKGASEICRIANESAPTKVTTEVSYVTNSGDTLNGYYVTTTDGTNMIFEYHYEKLATPAESIELDNDSRVIEYDGVINYIDGVYTGDQTEWRPGTGTAFDLKFELDHKRLKDVEIDDLGTSFQAKVSSEDLKSIIGTDLGAVGDASVRVETNGANLTILTVTCTTEVGTITIRTSYTYNRQNLTPEVDSDKG